QYARRASGPAQGGGTAHRAPLQLAAPLGRPGAGPARPSLRGVVTARRRCRNSPLPTAMGARVRSRGYRLPGTGNRVLSMFDLPTNFFERNRFRAPLGVGGTHLLAVPRLTRLPLLERRRSTMARFRLIQLALLFTLIQPTAARAASIVVGFD